MRWRILLVAVLAAVVAPLTLVGQADAAAVVVVDGGLNPKVLTVEVGTTVTWQFADASRHRIRSTTDALRFDSGNQTGGSFSVTFDRLGTFGYVDDEHKDLAAYQGTVAVTSGAPVPTSPPPTVPGPTTPGPTTPGPTTPGPTTPGPTTPGPTTPGPTTPPPPPAPASVRMINRTFSPRSITISAGATVTWRNDDKDRHTVTHTGGAFDSGVFSTGGTYSRAFPTAGTFAYFCDLHPDMTGTVNVTGGGGGGGVVPVPTTTIPGATTTTVPGGPTVPSTTVPGIPPVGANSVRMVDFAFEPATFTVKPGTTVTWVNAGRARHTVVATDGSFRSPDVRAGGTFQRTFPTSGSFAYFCDIHPEMTGVIAVTGSGGEPPPPPPPPPPTTPVTASGDVRMADFSFSPRSITITAGRSLTFVNTGAARHSATARDGSFDTGLIPRGGTGRVSFPTPGTFEYFCSIHSNMSGTVLVTGADGAPPPPPVERPQAPVATGDVRMVDFDYEPRQIEVTAGAEVGFVNAGVAPHTATAVDGSFDTGLVRSGSRVPLTFGTPGTFPIYCTIHPDMKATVLVRDASGAPPPPASETPAAAPSGQLAAAVTVFARSFEPEVVRIAVGGTVTWTMSGADPHIVEADDGSFRSGFMTDTTTFQFTFASVGTWEYHDKLHPDVVGTVEVVDPLAAAEDGAPTVKMIDNAFDPVELVVAIGDEVTWVNSGRAAHTVAAVDGSWASDLVAAGGEFRRRFESAGTFEYICTLHAEMTGTIVVEEATAGTGPAAVTRGDAAGTARSPESSGFSAGALISGVLLGMLLAAGLFLLGRRGRPAAAVRS